MTKTTYNLYREIVWDLWTGTIPHEKDENIKEAMEKVVHHLVKKIHKIEEACGNNNRYELPDLGKMRENRNRFGW